MTTTTYYDLNIVEGTDIVNPLTVDNPNYEKIDEVMHDNAVSGVTFATEIANATVHAITRENAECAVIRFIATSNWKAGDTITIDGVPVVALLPSGETLPDGAYVINANVLCILTGTNLTVYAERKKIENASEIRYKNTNVADAITDVADNITEINNSLIPNSLKNERLITQYNVDLLDGSLTKNETRFVALTSAINSPISSSGMALHKMELTNSEYFTNIVTLFILDSNETWHNYYHGATGRWSGWVKS